MITPTGSRWQRRARPLLGTLVEIGAPTAAGDGALVRAFEAIAAVQAALSRHEPASELSRFNALPAGAAMVVSPLAAPVLRAAQDLADESKGLFDVTLGRAPRGWSFDGHRLHKRDARATLDLGGIAKGFAVDEAVRALQAAGCAGGWVNAGGDLRCFGDAELTVVLRDEATGGARPFALLRDGAFATSHFGAGSRSALAGGDGTGHVSVLAAEALWADALTKLVAAARDPAHPALAARGAQAWCH